jgi:hypothetical protein
MLLVSLVDVEYRAVVDGLTFSEKRAGVTNAFVLLAAETTTKVHTWNLIVTLS